MSVRTTDHLGAISYWMCFGEVQLLLCFLLCYVEAYISFWVVMNFITLDNNCITLGSNFLHYFVSSPEVS